MNTQSTPRVSIGAVSERDVDLLLVEEFASSPDFVRWFLERIGATAREPVEVMRCRRSATDSTGESDVEVFIQTGDGVLAILVEDKVHAAAQPRQADRYRERGEGYVRSGQCGRFITVLLAPQTYLRGNLKGFDSTVSYEDLVGRFEHIDSTTAQSRFKAAVLRGAIEKATLGYQVVEDAPVTRFWKRYWERAQVIAPDLDMKERVGLPASSSFVYFRPGAMPRGTYLVHKMAHGLIDIQFDGMAEKLTQLRARYGPSLEQGMTITRAGKSGVIRIKVEKLRPTYDAEEQLESIDACLRRATEFLEWFRRARTLKNGPAVPAMKPL
jgi:hypothetical protein